MPIGDPVVQPIPAVGTAGTSYATQLVNFLTETRTRLEAKVPMGSLLVGLLDMANNAIASLQYVGLYDQASVPSTPVGSLQRYNGNLWYVSPSGAFQITNGAALNSTAVKGFTGDYGSPNPAEARFVDADLRYNFYDDYSGSAWAYVRARGFDVAGGATSVNRVRIIYGGVVDYSMTLPAALPAAKSLVHMSTSGVLTATNTLDANTDIVLQGTGKIQHGEKRLYVGGHIGEAVKHAGTALTNTAPGVSMDDTNNVSYLLPLYLEEWRIKKIQLVTDNYTAGVNITLALAAFNPSTSSWGDYEVSAAQATSLPFLTLATPYPVEDAFTSNYVLAIRVDGRGGGAGTFNVLGFYITYDVPA